MHVIAQSKKIAVIHFFELGAIWHFCSAGISGQKKLTMHPIASNFSKLGNFKTFKYCGLGGGWEKIMVIMEPLSWYVL